MKLRVLAIVPARGGSKGIPRKNARLLCGRPLLEYTAEAAHASHRLSRVILTTDDDEIAEIGAQCGLEVPFLRPATLARDDTPMLAVVQHAIAWADSLDQDWDAICVLQPTTPLRSAADIESCVALLERPEIDSAMTVVPVPAKYNPGWVYWRTADGLLRLATGELTPVPRRQDLPPAYHRDGSVYVVRTSVVRSSNSLYGRRVAACLTDPARAVNLDTASDWRRAERWIRRHGLHGRRARRYETA